MNTTDGLPEPAGDLGPFQALGRVARIFYAPRRAAAEIRDRPNWVFPLLLSLSLTFVAAAVLFDRPEWQQSLQKAVAASGNNLGELERVKLLRSMRIVGWIGFLAAPVIGNLFLGVILWGAAVLREGEAGFLSVFSLQLHVQMVTLIPQTAGLVYLFVQEGERAVNVEEVLPLSLAYFLPGGISPALRSLALSVDFLSLWYWILVMVGLAIVARMPIRRLVTPIFLLWILGVLLRAAATYSLAANP